MSGPGAARRGRWRTMVRRVPHGRWGAAVGRVPHGRWLALAAALAIPAVLVLAAPAGALSPSCQPNVFQATPQPPIIQQVVPFLLERTLLELWRQPCTDGSGETAVLLRATPLTPTALVCSASFSINQGALNIPAQLAQVAGQPFCAVITGSATFVLSEAAGQPPFDETAAFSLVHGGTPPTLVQVPPQGPVSPLPSVTVLATGCRPCRPGDAARFVARIANPGMPVRVALKTGARLPDASIAPLLDPALEVILPGGQTVEVVLLELAVPAELPVGTYVVESALLEPVLGVTLSRSGLTVDRLP